MLVSYKDVRGFHIVGADGELGTLHDVYVDSQHWQARYLVLEAGSWFSSNKLLLQRDQVSGVDVEQRRLTTALHRSDLKAAPSAGSVQTVDDLNQPHWNVAHGHGLMLADMPGTVLPYSMIEPMLPIELAKDDPNDASVPSGDESRTAVASGAAEGAQATARRHLRSANELRGYELQGADDRIGTVDDLILNPDDWAVSWLSVDTGNWLPGRLVVVSPMWVTGVSWDERCFSVSLGTQQIEQSPPLADLDGLERSAEEALHAYYALPMI